MPTKIDIVSNALVLIGHPPISSFDPDQGAGATVGAALYDTHLESMLSVTYWRFSVKQQSLNRLSASPLNKWKYAFQLPTDYLTMHRISPRSNYQIYQDNIFSDQTSLEADYTFVPDATELPSYFVMAFQYKLASDFAISITNDTQKNAIYESKYDREVKIAMAADAKSHPPEPIQDQPFTDVRLGGQFNSLGGS
jgi:hypothetical protein